jgi:uncharacterized protein YdeI (YjbR/CyaY-like superfamily)
MGRRNRRDIIRDARRGNVMTDPTFFKSGATWRKWLEKNHDKATEKVVGFHKAGAGKTGITRQVTLDEALCFGWIDGVAKGGDTTWQVRFSPRRKKSIWSQINIKRVRELTEEGRMHSAGVVAFEARDPARQNRYSGENRNIAFSAEQERRFRANRKAWENFSAMPPSYRRPATWWVVSAKREDTQTRRLATLIEDSQAGRRLKQMIPPTRKT